MKAAIQQAPAPAKRLWRLPSNDELSAEQDAILDAPDGGHMLVTGGPGTGKTTIALLRAIRMGKDGKRVQVLVYNNTLKAACKGQLEGTPGGCGQIKVETAIKWAKMVCRSEYRIVPQERFDVPWREMERRYYTALEKGLAYKIGADAIMVDEGQDLARDFYEFMRRHETPVIVTADDQQRFTECGCTESDIAAELGVDSDAYVLTRNYRNSRQIHDLARIFHKGAQDTPESPDREDDKPKLVSTARVLDYLASLSAKQMKLHSELTAIITVKDDTRVRLVRHLEKIMPAKWVQTYEWGKREPRFDQGGFVVLCSKSCKGLEFDNVVVATVDDFPLSAHNEETFREFYVVATRARKRLVMLQHPDAASPLARYLASCGNGLFTAHDYPAQGGPR